MRITVRPARRSEMAFLQSRADRRLPEGYEPVDLKRGVVYVADEDGVIAGLGAASLVWQIDPLILMSDFERYAPPAAKKRATYLLAEAVTRHLADPELNCGVSGTIAHLNDPEFEKLAVRFGMWKAYEAGRMYRGGRA